jgi:hypothetical protein
VKNNRRNKKKNDGIEEKYQNKTRAERWEEKNKKDMTENDQDRKKVKLSF